MCRLAAFPPGFEQKHAINILARFSRGNGDGTGSVYVRNGEFVVNKWPLPVAKVVNRGYPLLDHMPYNGWTVVHLRAASHGGISKENTHPFLKGDWAIVHNGIWSEYELVQAALKKFVTFDGETDSEVAAQLFSTVGPKRFSKLIDFSGVFLGLNKSGELWSVKTSGDLEMAETKYGNLLASALPEIFRADEQPEGWLRFNDCGDLIGKQVKKTSFKNIQFEALTPDGLEETSEKSGKKFGFTW